ncbi:hypothetical protein Nepgr_019371 [Nepenthes gracilis]|uniref:Serine/threonine-protein kinase 11-interacting protein n=1 Tax=Nepenthes gracilis TaxID=150966 RepID=A0AAD3SV12_NEPGR|nr:hypothetical protein Nepgr_019371 [Nepenthes gracilis]
MSVVTGDRYLDYLVKFVDKNAGPLIDGTLVLKLNPAGLHYVQSRLEALNELERLISGAPVDYLRAYISDLGDHRALEQLRRILCRLTSLKVVSVLPPPARDPTPLSLLPFSRLKVLELRGCDLSTSTAKGLLELRHTLEKLICLNSTDALRHVFATRIAEIMDSPQWNRLSFVSCACNSLVLMDESLQLLSAVETLDLSRNKFAKIDNLRKCTRLIHLDLGFNQLRSVASFGESSYHILKLVLRNNALTTLRGIENLKSLEGLDLSYNIISNFSELEALSGLPSLKNLWLEGNPLSCARWYRPQVFSFFSYPNELKVDDKEMSTKEFWKRQIIIARRQKRPAGCGFYSPAREDAKEELTSNRSKKASRLAFIESEERSIYSEYESAPCNYDIRYGNENIISDDEAEIGELINGIEIMKKERSSLWLRDFKEWMDLGSDNFVNESKTYGAIPGPHRGNYLKFMASQRHVGESSRYMSDSIRASGEDSSINILESGSSLPDLYTGFHTHHYVDTAEGSSLFFVGATIGESDPVVKTVDLQDDFLKSNLHVGEDTYHSLTDHNSDTDILVTLGGNKMNTGMNVASLTPISDIMESQSSSACHGSPPHYQEDMLHRRHHLEEEFMQLSAKSFSIASSDSDTSSNKDEIFVCVPVSPQAEQTVNEELSRDSDGDFSYHAMERSNGTHEVPQTTQNGRCSLDLHAERTSFMDICSNDVPSAVNNGVKGNYVQQDGSKLEKKYKKKPKRRVISLLEENVLFGKTDPSCEIEPLKKSNEYPHSCIEKIEDDQKNHTIDVGDFDAKEHMSMSMDTLAFQKTSGAPAKLKPSALKVDDYIENYFNSIVEDSGNHETFTQYILCNCLIDQEAHLMEREVIVLLSSEHKFYVLLTNPIFDGSGNGLSLVSSHKMEDVNEVLVGLALQVVRVHMDGEAAYLFITKSAEISMQLLRMLEVVDSHGASNKCSLKSLEQFQIDSFYKFISGVSEINVYQYCMVLFQQNDSEEEQWVSRSLFINGGHLFVCMEDILQFSSILTNSTSSQYYFLDSSCSIGDVSEMVIETRESRCVTLTLGLDQTECCLSAISDIVKLNSGFGNDKMVTKFKTWKLRWFCEESLFKFVALIKAIHAGLVMSSLSIRCVS